MFPTLDLRTATTDHARGVLHGQGARAQVAHSVSTYARMFAGCGIGWAQACHRAQAYAEVIAALSPRWLAEMRGIAEGSGQPLNAILALNCRTEILPPGLYAETPDAALVRAALAANTAMGLADWGSGGAAEALSAATQQAYDEGECTTLCVAPPVSADGHAWLAQNWDWLGRQRAALVLLKTPGPEGHTITTLTEAGMLAKIGLHEAGFGLGLNILRSVDDGARPGVPVHVLLRHLLDCSSLAQARAELDRAARLGFGAGSNIACVDASGDIACFELAPKGWAEWPAVRGRVSHSNHYLSPALQAVQAPMAAALSTTSRLDTACRHGDAERVDRAGLEAFLRDTSGGYLAVCRHPDPALPPEACVESVAGVMIDASARQMWVAPGVPDTVAFALV
jgi:isopenicillin-N N-acyltransferase-like protein